MLYSKFVIEIVYSNLIIGDISLITDSYSKGISFDLDKQIRSINTIKYVDDYGSITANPFKFYTYEQAFECLERYYNILNSNVDIITYRICEVYDHIEPPLLVMRALKLNKIKRCIKNR